MKRLKEKMGKAEKSACEKNQKAGHENAGILFENKILTNPVLTDLIFADILPPDFLNCCLISKAWNLTCRRIIVDRFRTNLTLSGKSTVERLDDFYNVIRGGIPGHQQPFNGIRVKFETQIQEWPFFSEPYVDLIRRIMEQMQVKFVSFHMKELQLKAVDFFNIFKSLVIPHLGTIEFLEILNFNGVGSLNSLSQQLKKNSLPNLKILDLDLSQDELKTLTFKRILKACPNLKEFPYVFPYQLPTLKTTDKLHLASKVQFKYMKLTPIEFQLLLEYSGVIKRLKMFMGATTSKIELEGERIQRLQSTFSPQLQLNLECLQLEHELLVAILLQNSFPPLTNLKTLVCWGSQEWFSCLYKSGTTRFAQFLPNLKTLTIIWFPWESEWLQEKYGNEDEVGPFTLYQRSTSVSLDSVRELKFGGCGFELEEEGEHETYETLTKLMDLHEAFPCVTYLHIGFRHSELEDLLKWICECWGDLLKTLILGKSECSSLMQYAEDDEERGRGVSDDFLDAMENKRKALPAGIQYSDKLCRLQRLEVAFRHPVNWSFEPNYKQETTEVRTTFKPRDGQEVKILISGCRAQKRMSRVKCGVSVYDTILALQLCPQDLELTPMEEIIATESICKRICKLLPQEDLLNCSLVNRKWNASARLELHQSRPCILSLDPIDDVRQKLIWLAQGGEQEFFNCLSTEIYIDADDEDYEYSEVKAHCRFIKNKALKHKRFKALKVPGRRATEKEHRSNDFYLNSASDDDTDDDFDDDSEEDSDDNLTTMLDTFFKTIVLKLELDHVQTLVTSIATWNEFFRDYGRTLLVPNLKSIKFVDAPKLTKYPEVLKHLFEELKFLERIDNHLSNESLAFIASVGKASVVKHIEIYEFSENLRFFELKFHSWYEKDSEEDAGTALESLLEFAECSIALESISVANHVILSKENEPILRKLFQQFCASSYKSLSTLRLSLPLLWLVSLVYTRPLVAVQKITLWNDEGNFDPQQLLSQVPFSLMLPNLKEFSFQRSLKFDPRPGSSSSIEKQFFEPTKVISPQPCVTVTVLDINLEMVGTEKLNCSSQVPWEIGDVAALFPHVREFAFAFFGSTKIPGTELTKILGSLWKSWPKLESLRIHSTLANDVCSLESWILGISEQEWSFWEKELQGDGEPGELLSKLQFVPSTVSFRNCKDLRKILVSRETETVLIQRGNYVYWKRLCLFEPWTSDKNF